MKSQIFCLLGASVMSALVPLSVQSQAGSDAVLGVRAPVVVTDSVRRRPRAIEYSDAYATRLTIHRIGSYAMLPLVASEWVIGDRLMQPNHADWVRPAHVAVATGIGALFAVNTVTGVWNLVESRNDPAGRTRRLLHSALMIAADAGFVYTAMIADDDDGGESSDDEFRFARATASGALESSDDNTRHKNAALVSIGISTVGTVMMWLWKD
jgi:hypothetical protein